MTTPYSVSDSQSTHLVEISKMTKLIAEALPILFFIINGWSIAENKIQWPHCFLVIDS